jgi:hypothetical protein
MPSPSVQRQPGRVFVRATGLALDLNLMAMGIPVSGHVMTNPTAQALSGALRALHRLTCPRSPDQ